MACRTTLVLRRVLGTLAGLPFVVAAASVAVEAGPAVQHALPDPLRFEEGGGAVTNASGWWERRRPEIFRRFATQVYGWPPPPPGAVRWRVLSEDAAALEGRAHRREVALELGETNEARVLRFTVFVPRNGRKAHPVFAGVHLFDTAKPHPEPAVARRIKGPGGGAPEQSGPPGQVGRDTAREILGRGYALASIDIESLGPDSRTNWWRGLLRVQGRAADGPPGPEETGVLGVWAWGLSRVVDYCATTPDLDPRRVIAIGHSRMGKAALWAGAVDERLAAVISNDSGCGGAALSKRIAGETVAIITRAFPHWFCGNFSKYADREADLAVDQHQLLALIAPRPLYVASAEDDAWADPLGEYLAAWHASAVYRLLGATGVDELPARLPTVDVRVGGALSYHVRRGQHDLTDFDWRQYLDFADRHVSSPDVDNLRTHRSAP